MTDFVRKGRLIKPHHASLFLSLLHSTRVADKGIGFGCKLHGLDIKGSVGYEKVGFEYKEVGFGWKK